MPPKRFADLKCSFTETVVDGVPNYIYEISNGDKKQSYPVVTDLPMWTPTFTPENTPSDKIPLKDISLGIPEYLANDNSRRQRLHLQGYDFQSIRGNLIVSDVPCIRKNISEYTINLQQESIRIFKRLVTANEMRINDKFCFKPPPALLANQPMLSWDPLWADDRYVEVTNNWTSMIPDNHNMVQDLDYRYIILNTKMLWNSDTRIIKSVLTLYNHDTLEFYIHIPYKIDLCFSEENIRDIMQDRKLCYLIVQQVLKPRANSNRSALETGFSNTVLSHIITGPFKYYYHGRRLKHTYYPFFHKLFSSVFKLPAYRNYNKEWILWYHQMKHFIKLTQSYPVLLGMFNLVFLLTEKLNVNLKYLHSLTDTTGDDIADTIAEVQSDFELLNNAIQHMDYKISNLTLGSNYSRV